MYKCSLELRIKTHFFWLFCKHLDISSDLDLKIQLFFKFTLHYYFICFKASSFLRKIHFYLIQLFHFVFFRLGEFYFKLNIKSQENRLSYSLKSLPMGNVPAKLSGKYQSYELNTPGQEFKLDTVKTGSKEADHSYDHSPVRRSRRGSASNRNSLHDSSDPDFYYRNSSRSSNGKTSIIFKSRKSQRSFFVYNIFVIQPKNY